MKGHACLTHDLTTYSKCGHCHDEWESLAKEASDDLATAHIELLELKSKCSALDDAVKELQKILNDGNITVNNLTIHDYICLMDANKEDADNVRNLNFDLRCDIKKLLSLLNPNNCRSGTGVEEHIIKTIKEKIKYEEMKHNEL